MATINKSEGDRLKYGPIPFNVHEGVSERSAFHHTTPPLRLAIATLHRCKMQVLTDVEESVYRCKIMYVYKERSDFCTVL